MKWIVRALAFSCLIAAAQSQSPSKPAGIQWSLRQTWGNAVFADLGHHGTLAWGGTDDSVTSLLLSRFDANPPSPLWQVAYEGEPLASDAAKEADLFATIARRNVGGPNDYLFTLRVGTSQGLQWAYDHPWITAGWSWVSVSRDGSRVVACFTNPAAGSIDIAVFSRDSSVPLHIWQIPSGALWAMEASDDATRAALSVEMGIVVVDLTNGAILFDYQDSFYVSNRPVALSGDGLTLAYPASGMRVHRWNGAGYQHLFTQPLAGSVLRLALSRDGDTCAWGVSFFTYPVASTEVWTQCLDVPTQSLTMTEIISSSGTKQNFATDIEVSDDGGVIAAAQAGDEPNQSAEVRVFRRHSSLPFYTLNLTGSALDIDVSADGRWLLVGSRSTHFSGSQGSAGRWDLIHLGGDQVEVLGIPSPGATPVLIAYGVPGSSASLLVGSSVLDTPIDVGASGELWLDRGSLRRIDLGTIGPDGSVAWPFQVPDSGAPSGVTWNVQSLSGQPGQLSSNWLPITSVP